MVEVLRSLNDANDPYSRLRSDLLNKAKTVVINRKQQRSAAAISQIEGHGAVGGGGSSASRRTTMTLDLDDGERDAIRKKAPSDPIAQAKYFANALLDKNAEMRGR